MANTGPLAPFGETAVFAEEYCLNEINRDGGIYIKELGNKLPVRFLPVDSESNPTKAAELATRLVMQDKVDIITVASTSDTTNPVASICERYGVPCVCGVPYEAWVPGGPYQWTYNMFWPLEEMAALFVTCGGITLTRPTRWSAASGPMIPTVWLIRPP
jgi:branched-chain amino acid transport system substrate-binding protein